MTQVPRKPGLDVDDAAADHFLGLPGAHTVATDTLLLTRDNLADCIDAKAMACVHGDAGLGKTLSVNASLRELLTPDMVCRVQFRARPTPRDIRHTLFDALAVGGTPPRKPIEFDLLLKDVLRTVPDAGVRRGAMDEPRVLRVLAPPEGRPTH